MSTNKIIAELDAEQMSRELPDFAPGDTLVVQVKVKEGNRERLQAFEGVCIGKRNRGLNSAFMVRKISHGVGVERTFQTYSPLVDSINVKRRGDVRQAKLYYLRELSGKAAGSRKSCPQGAAPFCRRISLAVSPASAIRAPQSDPLHSPRLLTAQAPIEPAAPCALLIRPR